MKSPKLTHVVVTVFVLTAAGLALYLQQARYHRQSFDECDGRLRVLLSQTSTINRIEAELGHERLMKAHPTDAASVAHTWTNPRNQLAEIESKVSKWPETRILSKKSHGLFHLLRLSGNHAGLLLRRGLVAVAGAAGAKRRLHHHLLVQRRCTAIRGTHRHADHPDRRDGAGEADDRARRRRHAGGGLRVEARGLGLLLGGLTAHQFVDLDHDRAVIAGRTPRWFPASGPHRCPLRSRLARRCDRCVVATGGLCPTTDRREMG